MLINQLGTQQSMKTMHWASRIKELKYIHSIFYSQTVNNIDRQWKQVLSAQNHRNGYMVTELSDLHSKMY